MSYKTSHTDTYFKTSFDGWFHKTTQTESYYKTIEGAVQETDAPIFIMAYTDVDGEYFVIQYQDASGLDTTSVPDVGDFVFSGSSSTISSIEVTNFEVIPGLNIGAVILNVDNPIYQGEVLSLSYTPGANPIQDVAGNLAAALSNQSVTNNSTQSATNKYYTAYYDARTNKPTGAVATSLELLCEKLSGDNNLSFDFLNNSDRFGLIGIDTMADGDWAIDLKDPTKSINDVNNTYKNIYSGVKGDDLTKYINTEFRPAINGNKFTLNDASFWKYGLDRVADTSNQPYKGNGNTEVRFLSDSTGYARINSGGNIATTDFDRKGLEAVNRYNSNDIAYFTNGTNKISTRSSTLVSTIEIDLLRYLSSYSDERIGAWGAGGSMTEAQCQELETILDWWFNFEWLSLGSELITDGGFDNPAEWITTGGWSISGGKAVFDGSATGNLAQNIFSANDDYYLVELTISGSGNKRMIQPFVADTWLTQLYTSLTGTVRLVCKGNNVNTAFNIRATAGASLDIDNVSIKKIIGL